MFSHRPRSWRELPLRFADFGVLHRNELSGTLTGLTRVRRFQQDDAHIFCTMEQIESEMKGSAPVHAPREISGRHRVWNQAEKQLENSLNDFGEPWKLNPGDGAFYGPKIDIKIKDAIGRYHQCATIQLDFQLPIRLNLTFVGSMCVSSLQKLASWRMLTSTPAVCLNKKIRNAQLAQYNFILVVGEKEKMTNGVNVRTRDSKVHGELSVSEVLARLILLKQSRCANAEEEF
ncbi:hypothetical protein KUCAC02_002377 [Chaenocephalus aceratus]|uniref:Uncharacterized protein n=1 Tax=Chaenocephalus aceratus TaxID=36190 RepID=A0ACB9XV24_CHAAC|nr:hypothetical protein KUCAC02_002377 [Chaenocephalus aceratus]